MEILTKLGELSIQNKSKVLWICVYPWIHESSKFPASNPEGFVWTGFNISFKEALWMWRWKVTTCSAGDLFLWWQNDGFLLTFFFFHIFKVNCIKKKTHTTFNNNQYLFQKLLFSGRAATLILLFSTVWFGGSLAVLVRGIVRGGQDPSGASDFSRCLTSISGLLPSFMQKNSWIWPKFYHQPQIE
jgi:hypothetical protein